MIQTRSKVDLYINRTQKNSEKTKEGDLLEWWASG